MVNLQTMSEQPLLSLDREEIVSLARETQFAPNGIVSRMLLRAPNGVIQDARDYWAAGRPYYDPAAITAATLLIHGEWDQDTPGYMAQAIFGLLSNVVSKRLVVIGEGTHTVVMEKNRMQLLREVQLFLED